ncbi:MAG: HAMP domain-containing sensor histidine kinase [Chloroflexota bacterium]|nr:HAMP domain-containing sensor histidine kinase [Chloroflexota bacterium]
MSLRARLALLYTFILGGILLVFGTAVYAAVSLTLTRQVDITLANTANTIVDDFDVNPAGELSVDLPNLVDLSTDVYVQVWGRNDQLIVDSPNLPRNYNLPLDPVGLSFTKPAFRDIYIGSAHFRVLTVPLTTIGSDRVIGYLQVGTSMALVDAALQILVVILLVASALAMTIAGVAGWFSTKRALRPLESVTQTALQITVADDLSRRIPYGGPPDDEIGQLIRAFNQTLSRLENLFNSQRRFLADVGHELRTPLTVIRGNIDLMRRMGCTDDESIEGIESEVDRLTRMVGDLLLLAQAESGKLPLDLRQVEVDTLLLEVIQQMQVLVKNRLTLTLGEFDQVQVCGDRDRLKQVLVNLIGNAIKYTHRGGEVIIGLGKTEERVKIIISDNGPGIPPEELPYIFERFYRGEKSRTRSKDGKGFGLGLSIAYWIVRNHGGTIDVSSRVPQGTTFCVWLPLTHEACAD